MRLGSGIAVAVVQAGSCGSDSAPSLETSICHWCGPKETKKKKKKRKRKDGPQGWKEAEAFTRCTCGVLPAGSLTGGIQFPCLSADTGSHFYCCREREAGPETLKVHTC